MTIAEQAAELFQFRNHLLSIGCTDEMTAEVIQKFGIHIPVFSTQLDGFYIREDGRRDYHHAVPGWYSILSVEGKTMRIRKPYVETADAFECGTFWVPSVIGANMEMMDKGFTSPDNTFEPKGETQ